MNITALSVAAHREQPKEKAARKAILSRRQELNLQLNQLIDAGLLVFSFWCAHTFRLYLNQFDGFATVEPFNAFLWLIFFAISFGPLLLRLHGFYKLPLQKSALTCLGQIAEALLWLGVLIAGCAILFRLDIHSRSVLILFVAISGLLLLIRQRVALAYYRLRARSGGDREEVILIGSEEISQPANHFNEEQLAEINVVKRIDICASSTSELVKALHQYSVSRVIFASAKTELWRVEEAIAACEIEGVEAWLMVDFIRTSIARPAFDMFGPQPMLVFRSAPDISWALIMKRTIDLVGATAGILLLLPLMLIVAIAIKATSPGPAIFNQMRSGKHGRPFRMYKFRSMYSDAELRRHDLERYNQMTGPVFKLDCDPRITPLGRWLRKYSVDELPQLFNVLSGQMSLIGPRPLPVYEVENFANPAQRRRLSVKPGLTCLWQISGRNQVRDFETWVKLDLEYIDNWSIWLDLRILLRTIPVVILGYGAK
jgi:exopolysaccharide biosynthesis polyprenyl glycosylphosphotransferase